MRRRGWLVLELAVLAVLTFAGYWLLWSSQHAMWTNGLTATSSATYPRAGADADAGAMQSARVILFGVLVTALFGWMLARAPRFASAGLGWYALGIPAVVAVALFFTTPTLSIDAYSYLSHGYLAATPGSNPYVDPSAFVAGTPYGEHLLAAGWQAVHPQTPYGPVWTTIERLAFVASGGNVYAGILLVKLPVVLAVFGTALLIRRFLLRTRSDRALGGTLLYLANPLVLIELAGEGHNDGVMAFFLVLAIVAAARRWAFLAVVALTFSVLVKLNALPFALPLAVALIATRRSWSRLVWEVGAGVILCASLTVGLMVPYWAGSATFLGLVSSGTPSPGLSVSGLVLNTAVIGALLVLGTAAASILARTVRGLVLACGIVSLLVLLLLPLEWPWYAALPAAVLPLEAGLVEVVAVLVLTLGSRLVAPIGDAASLGVVGTDLFTSTQELVGQTIPAIVGLAVTVQRPIVEWRAARRERRMTDRAG
ncbi:hypothetical protein HII28_04060 [Planctomonas sp. JC2975]|uniref:hypothetical protein n=1 Tax=Planctomonas sp. JC2975 TaxID=2729626 RepID=UPI0014759A9A|nr:hypothetical protein [Planctomonas sp. JC2975]NNC11054.1 hypothetical protein [Planctomonas sp. JC2975]